ncbi:MAG: inosine-5-monophosphate dehydrogenase [Candidatus Arcticimaribacter sp.]|nr:CBS domain-containing protein [Flavobacteriaceae bacterium]MDB9899725.1 CBS domain-containing protein [Flavobacteriaceae bacterium]MDC1285448.1 CBS domain-containing protein [Flavobacteriaceae bacterium]PSR10759.1 MAG: inosine-5-monophosphate dehydrogenase [Candidatus Arcticimaribacter sp.]
MAIKSFQGERETSKKVEQPTVLVKDIMTTNLVLFTVEQSIHEVMNSFIKNKISGGPVVDDRGKLIGVISEADCMKEVSDSRYFNMPILDKSVGHFMTKEVETLPASMTLFDAASRFHETSRRRFPVLDNNKLVGQISRKDIVIAAINLKSQSWR